MVIFAFYQRNDTHFFSHGEKKFISCFRAAKVRIFFASVTGCYRFVRIPTDLYRFLLIRSLF